jgi:hypothetical protein
MMQTGLRSREFGEGLLAKDDQEADGVLDSLSWQQQCDLNLANTNPRESEDANPCESVTARSECHLRARQTWLGWS